MLRIKKELEERHMSQSQLARMADVNQVNLNRIVNGKEPAYPNRGKRIAAALDWQGDPNELFEEVNE
jgi:transcriptional regulator with XRE-family HTH domain